MVNRIPLVVATIAAAIITTACGFEHERGGNVLAPTEPGTAPAPAVPAAAPAPAPAQTTTPVMTGVWGGTNVAPPSASSCTNFQWRITNQTPTSLDGEFSAECAAGLAIRGTASGQLVGGTVPITVVGTATMPGIPACAFVLNGTGTIEENNNALRIPYTGTTCLGPVQGTEVLRRRVETAAPPAPEPTPPPAAAEPGTTDAMDLRVVAVYNSPIDIANWAVTTKINRIDLGTNGVFIDFDKKDVWPEVTPPGWEGPLTYTLWIVINVNGRWYTSGCIEYWRGLDRNGGPPAEYAANWYYDAIRWGPMVGHQPAPGETVGFFVSAGDARNNGPISVKERSNVVMVPFPGAGGGAFGF
jgi:hypothetical protein